MRSSLKYKKVMLFVVLQIPFLWSWSRSYTVLQASNMRMNRVSYQGIQNTIE